MTSQASRGVRLVVLIVVTSIVASCGVPRIGPNRNEIFAGSLQREGDAFVVEVNQRVLAATSIVPALGFTGAFLGAQPSSTEVIRPGDIIGLTIYENVEDGLLADQGTNAAMISDVQVDSAGFIFIPYAGRIRAAGNTPDALREIITRNLDEQTPDPQVLVTRVAGSGATVSITGGVGAQGVYPIERPTRTLSGMLAAAGGLAIERDIAQITVARGDHMGTVWFDDLYDNPANDIALRAGDRILVQEDSRSFTALGATGRQARVAFESRTISGIEAIATVGGLNANLADPTGVFVLRNEPEEIAEAVLDRDDLIGAQRMVYVLDLTAPTGMFEARDFAIRDGDTVYVTEAPFAQWSRVIAAFTGSLGTVNAVRDIGTSN